MKNFILITLFVLYALSLTAQDITLSFKAEEASATIDSVQATNLATNNTVFMLGNETLTLVNSTTGINSMQDTNGSIFPNPCKGSAILQFSTVTDDNVSIQITNASGQLVMDKKQVLSSGGQRFSVNFSGSGVYIVLVKTSNGILSFKEIVTNSEIHNSSLEYTGSTPLVHLEDVDYKSATTGKTLNYSTGDNIMYTLYSGKNSRVMVDQPAASKTYDVAFYECADKDGKNYKTVTIGTQTWMDENLSYLPSVNTTYEYSYTASRYYVYGYNGNNISAAKITNNYKTYGVLYNWPAALSACPAGWHLPSDAEWTILSDYLGGEAVAGGKMKSTTGWGKPGTNETGFSALPSGNCSAGLNPFSFWDGGFYGSGYWWSNTSKGEDYAWLRHLPSYNNSSLIQYCLDRSSGFSVRCVRDL